MKTTSYFINKATEKHNGKYNYSKSIYTGASNKLIITCPEHGDFEQKAKIHLSGSGCQRCGRKESSKLKTTSYFINKATEKHNGKYNYSKSIYTGASNKLIITCPEHGDFEQSAGNHLQGAGCMYCRKSKLPQCLPMTFKNFISKAYNIHNYKYTYVDNSFEYSKKIKIQCPVHGSFTQLPSNHLNNNSGNGCPKCATSGFNPDKEATLYYLYDPQEDLYKIGITNKDASSRFGAGFLRDRKVKILMEESYSSGEQALLAEQELLQAFGNYRTTNPTWPEALGGKTEFFNRNILEL